MFHFIMHSDEELIKTLFCSYRFQSRHPQLGLLAKMLDNKLIMSYLKSFAKSKTVQV